MTEDILNKVNSSNIAYLRYQSNGSLDVKFKEDNCLYTYYDIPKVLWMALKNRNSKRIGLSADTEKYSVGKYFNKNIAQGEYKHIKTCK